MERAKTSSFLGRYPTPGALAVDLLPSTKQTPAMQAIDAELADLNAAEPGDKPRSRLMIFVPPQEGKSTRTSCWFPLWMLAQNPGLKIGIVSYSETKAVRWGRWLRRMIEAHGDKWGLYLRPDSRAVDRFETTEGGLIVSVGIGGGLTGEQVDLLIIDDPVRGRAEAESKTYREAAWDWWESVGATRLSGNGGKVVFMMTRWHADDLAGRLLKNEAGQWKVLRIPAVRDPEQPLVRGSDGASVYNPDGELISVQARKPGYYRGLEKTRSPYVWRSIYLQRPVLAEGNLFKRDDMRFWTRGTQDRSHHDPLHGARIVVNGVGKFVADMTRFITMDLAASTKTSADWTVVSVWAITLEGELVLLDFTRARLGEEDHWELARPMTEKWACPTIYVEKSFISSTMVRDATQAGARILPLTADTDKITRALPATQRQRVHQVFFPAGVEWLDIVLDECAQFPSGDHDDFVDTYAYAARVSSAHWTPPPSDPGDREQDGYRAARQNEVMNRALEAAIGYGGEVDLNDAVW